MRILALNVEGVKRQLRLDEEVWRRTVPQAVMIAAAQMVPVYVEMTVPRRTGRLQASAKIQVWPTRMRLTFDSPYAEYVDEGTPPSEGRYVPEPYLGRRLIKPSATNPSVGMHPGIRGVHFSEEIVTMMKEDLGSIINALAAREWIR